MYTSIENTLDKNTLTLETPLQGMRVRALTSIEKSISIVENLYTSIEKE